MSPSPENERVTNVRNTGISSLSSFERLVDFPMSFPSKNAITPTHMMVMIITGFIFHHIGPFITRSEKFAEGCSGRTS